MTKPMLSNLAKKVDELTEEIAELKSTNETVTETGVVVSIDAEAGAELKVEADNTEPVKLVHHGKNFISFPSFNTIKNGVTVITDYDGTITANGTPTSKTYLDFATKESPIYLPAGIYAMSMIVDGIDDGITTGIAFAISTDSAAIYLPGVTDPRTAIGNNLIDRNRVFELKEGRWVYGNLNINAEFTCNNVKAKVQVERAKTFSNSDDNNYSAYEQAVRSEIEANLPATIEALDGTNIVYTTTGDALTVSTEKKIDGGIDKNAVNALIADALKFDPIPYGLPILYLEGDAAAMNKDNEVDLDYVYGERSGTASVKWQGSSSLTYPKKNYTIKFAEAFEVVEGWGAQKKYCLKANYIDFSHSRNVCGAKLWGNVVKSRTTANENLAACPNYGAINGFPICVVINGEFTGVYTWNIPKDGWMANMGSGTNEAIICADSNGDVCEFKGGDAVVGPDGSDFELEYVTDENNAGWVQTSLNNLIRACAASDGTDLDTTIAAMLDWDSAIDYYIFCALVNNYDGIAKNYLLFSYEGTKWLFSAYDMDSIFGLYPNGESWQNAKDGMTLAHLAGRHRVFNLIYNHKKDALKKRYEELRAGALSEDNVQYVFRNFACKIPKLLLEEDNRKWPTIPSTNINNVQQVIDWYRLRVARIDAEIKALT